jgi:adenine-specific DNA methylase
MGERMVAVVVEGKGGKDYRPVEDADLHAVKSAKAFEVEVPGEYIVPEINGPGASPDAGSHRSINLELYGFTRRGQLFSHRQLVLMDHLVKGLHEAVAAMEQTIPDADYRHALATYLALWIDRVAAFGNTFTRWRAVIRKARHRSAVSRSR